MAKACGGNSKAVKAVGRADPIGVLWMIQVVLRGGSLLVLPWARALVASGICGVCVAPIAASFRALWVPLGVSVVWASVLGTDVVGFPMLVVSGLMGHWCWSAGWGSSMRVVPLALVVF